MNSRKEQGKMGKDPAVLFYPADFLIGTADLSYEERGQYITLLSFQQQKGHLLKKLFMSVKPTKSVMDKFLVDSEGRYYNKRMDEEVKKREKFVKSRRENGQKGGRPAKTYRFPVAKPTENLLENENVNVDSFTLVKDRTKVLSSSEDINPTTFSFSNDNNDNNLLSTTTTKNNCYLLYRDGENEDGLLSEELEAIGEFLAGYFDDLSASEVFDIQSDFIAYNKARVWRGLGGEDVRQDITRYLRRWIKYDYPERKKRR